MKTIKFLAMASIALAMMFSCSDDKGNGSVKQNGKSTIVLKVSTQFGGAASRSVVGEVVPDYATPVNGGYVFFTSNGEIILAEAINTTDIVSAAGQEFTVHSDATNVYVVVNTPGTFNGASFEGETVAEMLETAFDVEGQNDEATGGTNGLGNAMMYGTAAINYSNKVDIGTVEAPNEVIQVAVNAVPSLSRLEFEGIGLVAGSEISEYTIEDIYLDNFHPQFTVAGAGYGDMLNSPTAAELTGRTGYDWAAYAVGDTYSAPDKGNADWSAGTDQVMAYQVAPGLPARIIIRLSGVSYIPQGETDPVPLTGDRYVTVAGWQMVNPDTLQPEDVATFLKGNVYHAENILFDVEHLHINPNPDDIDLYVTVTATPWVINVVTPVIP